MRGQHQYCTPALEVWDFDAATRVLPRLTATFQTMILQSDYLVRSNPYWVRKPQYVGADDPVS